VTDNDLPEDQPCHINTQHNASFNVIVMKWLSINRPSTADLHAIHQSQPHITTDEITITGGVGLIGLVGKGINCFNFDLPYIISKKRELWVNRELDE
jgi:hypothetical protein